MAFDVLNVDVIKSCTDSVYVATLMYVTPDAFDDLSFAFWIVGLQQVKVLPRCSILSSHFCASSFKQV